MTSVSVAASDRESPATDAVDAFAAVYDEHLSLLVGVAVDKFGIAPADAQTLAHEVFLAYFINMDDVRDTRAWLVGAISNASRNFLRGRDRNVPLTDEMLLRPDPRNQREVLPDVLACQEALGCLTAKCALVIHMHYVMGFTIPEIADQLKVTPTYAHKMVVRCMKQARKRYAGKDKKR